ncbi:hypothetical protein TRFO_26582 [Tritrichomonas foetus]|uniref:Homeobox domain-containing protein n=1 Tax=Tritrichomonas foetus TaxID=1144522 RepID=A0A1J4K3N8_9EUKA|nr:hypothetical protein TRFO_26582 [Tritrichomonas foetus]|eukprot:OHT05586.1 hypothetical protein TRFO_26582 [Tritrichomonas foetus]
MITGMEDFPSMEFDKLQLHWDSHKNWSFVPRDIFSPITINDFLVDVDQIFWQTTLSKISNDIKRRNFIELILKSAKIELSAFRVIKQIISKYENQNETTNPIVNKIRFDIQNYIQNKNKNEKESKNQNQYFAHMENDCKTQNLFQNIIVVNSESKSETKCNNEAPQENSFVVRNKPVSPKTSKFNQFFSQSSSESDDGDDPDVFAGNHLKKLFLKEKRRTNFTEYQKDHLLKYSDHFLSSGYKYNPNLIKKISNETGLTCQQVKTFYSNFRSRSRLREKRTVSDKSSE